MQKQMINSNQLDFREPTLQQVADLCSEFGFTCAGEADLACLRAVLREGFSRWGRPAPVPAGERQAAPVPVAVSERWPEFSDCDPSNDCVWCFNPVLSHWKLSLINRTIHTHWLPAHALPVPTTRKEENLE